MNNTKTSGGSANFFSKILELKSPKRDVCN